MTLVLTMMALKHKESAKLAMIQKMEILNKQIDAVEGRPDIDIHNPGPS